MLSPQDLSRLQLFRDRIVGGEQIAPEELREAIKLLRADRMKASERAAATRAKGGKQKIAPREVGELLGKLGL
jgi:hypothetical protein